MLFEVIEYAIILKVVLSYTRVNGSLMASVRAITDIFVDPVLLPIKKLQQLFFPKVLLDFSSVLAMLFLGFARKLILVVIGR